MSTLNIGKDFSGDPAGRYRSDGGYNGEMFREDYLRDRITALKDDEILTIILDDNVESYGSSFLTEAFAGMVKYGYIDAQSFLDKIDLKVKSNNDFEFYKDRIIKYVQEAHFNSKTYTPTEPLQR